MLLLQVKVIGPGWAIRWFRRCAPGFGDAIAALTLLCRPGVESVRYPR
ncbi:hypothetical protein BSIN_1496 [Burkholderia singularis]|uniref:Uncharacterized protein n=1 Tax=Burkholderia singularis TaxID=1503053 RepID=A0A238GYX7_9BURK|nr:hypothetical protein BSIN_1496 [Burkholderia singularis]